jgi:hypothetical protein
MAAIGCRYTCGVTFAIGRAQEELGPLYQYSKFSIYPKIAPLNLCNPSPSHINCKYYLKIVLAERARSAIVIRSRVLERQNLKMERAERVYRRRKRIIIVRPVGGSAETRGAVKARKL